MAARKREAVVYARNNIFDMVSYVAAADVQSELMRNAMLLMDDKK